MIQYPVFYRQFVVRTEGQFKSPPLPKVQRLQLPPMSLTHFIPQSLTAIWPTEDWYMYNLNSKPIRIEHVVDLVEPIGAPKRRTEDINSKIRDFRRRNPRFRPALELEEMKLSEQQIVTYNYGFLLERWKYQRSMFSNINRWTNIFNTFFSKAGSIVPSGYNQFIELPLPKQLPTKALLDKTETGWTTRNMASFNSYSMLLIHHIWMWLGENRHNSMIKRHFGNNLKGVHLVLRDGDRFSILDLERINSWRKPSTFEQRERAMLLKADPTAQLDPLPNGRFNPTAIQKTFLSVMISMMRARSADVPENLGDQEVNVVESSAEKELERIINNGQKSDEVIEQETQQHEAAVAEGEIDENTAFKNYDSETDLANLLAEIDKDVDALDVIGADGVDENSAAFDQHDDVAIFDEDMQEQKKLQESAEAQEGDVQFFPDDPAEAFKAMAAKAAVDGNISANEYRKMIELADSTRQLKAPFSEQGTLDEFTKVPTAMVSIAPDDPEIQIPDIPTVFDKTMLKSTLQVMDKRYAENVLQRDVAAMITQLQAAGVAIKDYDVQEVEDITGIHYEYTVQVKLIEGASSVLRFKLPKVEEDGNFKIAGVKYRLRKQRGPLPICKVGPSKVALTSYYGKVFVERSQRRVNDYYKWITNVIMAIGLDNKNDLITSVVPGNAFGPDMHGPRMYTSIAQRFRSFNLKIEEEVFECKWDATQAGRLKMAGSPIIAGSSASGTKLLMDDNDNLILEKDNTFTPIASLPELLGLDIQKSPVEFAELKVMSKMVAVGVVLGCLMGLNNLIKVLKPEHFRTVPTGKRLNLEDDEWAISFDDQSYIFSRSDRLTTMVLGGWREHKITTAIYPAEAFDTPDIYFNLFEDAKLGPRVLNELTNLQSLFVDPITKQLLIEMKEPTIWSKLLLRSCELLCTDSHPDEQDSSYTRIKGYERFAGAVYSELVKSVRIHNNRPGKQRYGLELNPYAVWIGIQQDPAKDQVSEINPIQNLKEQEAVTHGGTGGRNSRTMVKSTRVYHKNDMGVISESTVDAGDVAVNVFTSANPKFNSLRGTADRYSFEEDGATSLLSTSAMVSPGSTNDDPKRVNFIGIQNRHVVACEGYTQSWLRTGYEQVIPHRVGDLFAVTAKKPGKVISRNEHGIVVEYEDGKRQGVTLGRRFGNASGLTIPHEIHSDLKAGDVFAVGEPIAWNTGFFERDVLNPKQIVWKSAIICRVALMESPDTLEDSSAISQRLSEKMVTVQTKTKDIIVNFGDEIHKLVSEGQRLEPESILCYIEDSVSARSTDTGLDDATLDTLRVLGAQTPQAKIDGVVDRIEIYYNGDVEDMSPTLRKAVLSSDKRIAARNTAIGRKPFTGSVGDDFRIGTDPLLLDTACIRIYMSAKVPAGIGDKGVFGNQLKTVFGRVFPDNIRTESGLQIDATFGAKSVDARIVTSPDLIGTTTTMLMVGVNRVVAAYRGHEPKPLK